MPRKSKLQKSGKLNHLLRRQSMKKIRNDHIQGNYVYNKDVYGFYGI